MSKKKQLKNQKFNGKKPRENINRDQLFKKLLQDMVKEHQERFSEVDASIDIKLR